MIRTSLTVALLGALLTVGCGSGSSSKGSSGTTTAPATSANLPDPGGVISPLTTSATPVVATISTNAYTTFKENVSISDMALPSEPALANRALVVEDSGTLRILDLSGSTPQLDRALDLFAQPLPAGISTGKLRVQSATQALITTSGNGGEGIAIFDPVAAQSSSDVTWLDLNGVTANWPTGTLNDKGVDVGGTALPLTFTSDAVVSQGKLIWISSNFDASFDTNPGTITAFDLDTQTMTLSNGGLQQTSDFNPTGITQLQTPQGEALFVTNSGASGQGASIDVLDPVSMRLVGSIAFPTSATPTGRLTISPDAKRGYIGSQSSAEVYVVDLEGVGIELGNQTTADLSARYRGGYSLPSQAAQFNFISQVAVSHSGNFLYAASFNESAVYVIDLTKPEVGARVVGFQRSGDPANFEGIANLLAVRPGVPGVDFVGPSIFVGTINLPQADRTLSDVSVALDTVTVDRH